MFSVLPDLRSRWLAAADAAVVVVFTSVGLLSHDGRIDASGLARDSLPLLAGWFAATVVLRTYGRRTAGRLLAAWVLGIPAGVLLRALVLGRDLDGRQAAFLLTTLVFSLLLGVATRSALSFATAGGRERRRRDSNPRGRDYPT